MLRRLSTTDGAGAVASGCHLRKDVHVATTPSVLGCAAEQNPDCGSQLLARAGALSDAAFRFTEPAPKPARLAEDDTASTPRVVDASDGSPLTSASRMTHAECATFESASLHVEVFRARFSRCVDRDNVCLFRCQPANQVVGEYSRPFNEATKLAFGPIRELPGALENESVTSRCFSSRIHSCSLFRWDS